MKALQLVFKQFLVSTINMVQDDLITLLFIIVGIMGVIILCQWKAIGRNHKKLLMYEEKYIPLLQVLDEQNTKFRELITEILELSKDPEIKKYSRKVRRIKKINFEKLALS